jgi:hypothetical protein
MGRVKSALGIPRQWAMNTLRCHQPLFVVHITTLIHHKGKHQKEQILPTTNHAILNGIFNNAAKPKVHKGELSP